MVHSSVYEQIKMNLKSKLRYFVNKVLGRFEAIKEFDVGHSKPLG